MNTEHKLTVALCTVAILVVSLWGVYEYVRHYEKAEDPILTNAVNECATNIRAKFNPAAIKAIAGVDTAEEACRKELNSWYQLSKAAGR